MKTILILTFIFCFFISNRLLSQTSAPITAEESDVILNNKGEFFNTMSIEDILNTKIISASRKEEKTFDSPLSSWVITSQEIAALGATSIPDALRVCPGIIVRQVANGTYDVSIRGGIDGFPSYSYSYINSSILVMIDNRPVFSNLQGGTYWQNLPIGLTEIDRIEIVYGPSTPLYGPNAVSGVINIISKRNMTDDIFASGLAQKGTHTDLASTQIGFKLNRNLSIDFGIHYESRKRFHDEFYDKNTSTYRPLDSITGAFATTKELRFPESSKSLSKTAGTLNLHYQKNEDFHATLSTSANQNFGLMPLSTSVSLSNFSNVCQNISLKTFYHKFNLQASYLTGKQGLSGYLAERYYDYSNTDLYLDYDFQFISNKLSVKPAVSYQNAYANDLKYTVDAGKSGTFNSEGNINNIASSLKVDSRLIKNTRIILAGRYDKFNYSKKGVFSYQGILNFSENENNITRFVIGKSYNSAFLISTLVNSSTNLTTQPLVININLHGNRDLDLLSNTMYELGHRTKLNKLIFDFSVFHQTFRGFNVLINTANNFTPPNTINSESHYENLPLVVSQNGATVSLQSSFANNKIQFKPHLTIQKTQLNNYSPHYNNAGTYKLLNPKSVDSKENTINTDSKSTPKVWAGFNLLIYPVKKLTFDLSCSFTDNYVLHLNSEINTQTGEIKDQNADQIKQKTILSVNTTYKIHKLVACNLNFRNIFNQSSPEGFGSDKLGRSVLLGLNFNY